ncbi:hypothetical protein LCGC14_1163990 [marine sediment metagenome]|uniref:GIY-YIG domain-containing protein n=1 Tax=marine sediment metagenome TaxID=412755 RepID=A0A0F9LWV7_9ZZZZ
MNEIYIVAGANGVIYCLTNEINGKQYFGQTTANIKQYLEDHKKAAENGLERVIYRAIRKYGWNSFKKEVICECGDNLSLSLMEDFCINVFDSLAPNGYNLRGGGHHGKLSEETLKKMSIVKSGENNPMYGRIGGFYGRKHSEESKIKMRKRSLGRRHTEKTKIKLSKINKGKKLSEKHKQKISGSHKGLEHSKETKQKMKDNHVGMLGKKHLEKSKEKLKKTTKNKPDIFCIYCNKKYKFPKNLEKHIKICK